MSASKLIRQVMEETGTSVKQLSELLGIRPQSVSNALYKGVKNYDDFVKIVSLMGGTVQVKTPGGKVLPEDETGKKGRNPARCRGPARKIKILEVEQPERLTGPWASQASGRRSTGSFSFLASLTSKSPLLFVLAGQQLAFLVTVEVIFSPAASLQTPWAGCPALWPSRGSSSAGCGQPERRNTPLSGP